MGNLRQLLQAGEKKLTEAGLENANAECGWILQERLGISRTDRILKANMEIPEGDEEIFWADIKRRIAGEPLQYILGKADFMGLTFHVDSRCLIPRQDTEPMVERALEILTTMDGTDGCADGADGAGNMNGQPPLNSVEREGTDGCAAEPLRILDIGCGSGAIGLSIAKLYQGARPLDVTLVDLSEDALAITKENAQLLGLTDGSDAQDESVAGASLTFLQGDLLEPVEGQTFHMILSNPPYIPSAAIETLQVEIREHEPMLALDGGEDGLNPYRILIPQLAEHLEMDGWALLEIGDDQREDVCLLFEREACYEEVHGEQDLSGRDRSVFAKKIR